MVLIIGPKRFSEQELRRLQREIVGLEAVLTEIDTKAGRLCARINSRTSDFGDMLVKLLCQIGIGDISKPYVVSRPFSDLSPSIIVNKIEGLIPSSEEGRLCLHDFRFTDGQQAALDCMADKYRSKLERFTDSVSVYQQEQKEAHAELVRRTVAIEPFPQSVMDRVILYIDEFDHSSLLRMFVDLKEFSSGLIEESEFLCAFRNSRTTVRKFRKEADEERANLYVLRNFSSRVNAYQMITHAVDVLHERWLRASPDHALELHFRGFLERRYENALASVKRVGAAPLLSPPRKVVYFSTSDNIPDRVMKEFESLAPGKDDVWN